MTFKRLTARKKYHDKLFSLPLHKAPLTLLYIFFITKKKGLFHNLTRKLTPRPDPRAIKQQHPGNERQQSTHPAKERRGPLKRHGREHLARDQREHTPQHIPAKRLRRQRRARVAVVRIGQEIEHGEVDGEDAHCGATHRDRRHDPVDLRERSPAEPEQADGHQRALDAAEVEPPFGAA